jgi:peptide/nickel transport system substrate-binding protein
VVAAIVIVLIVIAAAAFIYLASSTSSSTTSSSSSSASSSSTASSSSASSSTSSSSSSSSSGAPNTLTIDDVFWPAPADLNQLVAIGEVPYPNWLTYTVYQPLVTLNASALYQQGVVQYLPDLASNFTQSADGMTYTFNLRQGVKFSDGNPFNAYQVWAEMYGFYYLSANSSSFLESYNVFNMSQVNFGPSSIALLNQSGLINPSPAALSMMQNQNWPIYVTSPDTIVFHLQAPFNYFLGTLVVYVGLMFDVQWLLDHGGFGTPAQMNTYFNQNPIPGTGPYVVSGFSEQSYVEFTQNPSYWGANLTAAQIKANPYLDPGHVKNVVVKANFNDLSRYTDLSSGQAQIAGILSQDLPLVQANPSQYGVFQFPSKAAVFVGIAMNTQRYPTNITAVRQAIVHAINYTAISDSVFFGGLNPMVGPEYPIFSQFYDLGNLPPYQYNVTEAQDILNAANIDPSTLPALQFRVVQGCDYCSSAAQIVQFDLSQIGLTVNIIVTPPSSYSIPNIAGTGSYSQALNASQTIAQLSWFGTGTFAPAADTPADNWLLSSNNETSSNNWAIYSNPVVQACVNAFTSTSNTTLLTELCTKAQAQEYSDAPYIWLGTIKLFFGAGSIVWDKSSVSSFYVDPVYSGQSSTVIFNTVTFVSPTAQPVQLTPSLIASPLSSIISSWFTTITRVKLP